MHGGSGMWLVLHIIAAIYLLFLNLHGYPDGYACQDRLPNGNGGGGSWESDDGSPSVEIFNRMDFCAWAQNPQTCSNLYFVIRVNPREEKWRTNSKEASQGNATCEGSNMML